MEHVIKPNLCEGCDLCCRLYKIYLFPKEAKKIAKKLKISYKNFVADFLDIYVELFPLKEIETTDKFDIIIIENKRYALFLTMALKQKNKACIFLENHLCTIYNVRPLLCKLFPNFKIANENFKFCKLDKQIDNKKDMKIYFPTLEKYLNDLRKKGFHKLWYNTKNQDILIKNKDLDKKIIIQILKDRYI